MTDFNTHLHRYVQAFEQLTPQNLHDTLMPMFAHNAYFEDPFNQVVGPDSIARVFEHMFQATEMPRFRVMNYALNEATGFIWWEFHFFDKQFNPHHILGVSKVAFNQSGRVLSHIDYWDSGKYIYQKVPLLATLVRWVNRKLSASQ